MDGRAMKIEQPEIETLKYLMDDQLGDSADEFERRQKALQWAIEQLEWRSMESLEDYSPHVDVLHCKRTIFEAMHWRHAKENPDFIAWRPRPTVPEVCDD